MTLRIERVGPESAATLLSVVHAAFGARPPLDPPAQALAETESSLAELVGRGGALLALRDGVPVGAVALEEVGSTLHLRRFGVLPSAQGRGVAGALIAAAEESAAGPIEQIAVLAREDLPETVAFWVAQGFGLAGTELPFHELRRPLRRTHLVSTGAEMQALGARLAALLRPGDLVVLSGGLGAGKTTFTQGIGEGLGVRGGVTSPTFVIARVHPSLRGGPDLVHVDAYRLGGSAELDDLDLDTAVEEAVTVVEWGEGLAEGLAESRLDVHIERSTGSLADPDDETDQVRRLTLTAVGPRWADFPGIAR